MAISSLLQERSNNICELCGTGDSELFSYAVPPRKADADENVVVLCDVCRSAVEAADFSDVDHWRALEGSIWSGEPSVQALSYKILTALSPAESWAADTLEAVSLDEAVLEWAGAEATAAGDQLVHKDAYGAVLEAGDTILLTQNLNVKGTNFTAPKGTAVKKIRLVPDNAEHIEGKINGDTIVILTKYVKKQG
jgi:protein PhnA